MSANVALSDTFDQWRVKNNELLVITQTDGSDNFISIGAMDGAWSVDDLNIVAGLSSNCA